MNMLNRGSLFIKIQFVLIQKVALLILLILFGSYESMSFHLNSSNDGSFSDSLFRKGIEVRSKAKKGFRISNEIYIPNDDVVWAKLLSDAIIKSMQNNKYNIGYSQLDELLVAQSSIDKMINSIKVEKAPYSLTQQFDLVIKDNLKEIIKYTIDTVEHYIYKVNSNGSDSVRLVQIYDQSSVIFYILGLYQDALEFNRKAIDLDFALASKGESKDVVLSGEFRKSYLSKIPVKNRFDYNTILEYKLSNSNYHVQVDSLALINQLTTDKLTQERKAKQVFVYGIILMSILLIVIFIQGRKITLEKSEIEHQKTISDNLLLNILPAEVAEELKDKGKCSAKQFDHVSVLLLDFVDFTQSSEALTPKLLLDEINECFTKFDEIIDKFKMEKIKTTGDAYLAVSGLPKEKSDHALTAIMAAKEIIGFVEARALQKDVKLRQVRIGINSGAVVAGIVGVKKFAYDIWGDTVNIAARMEQSCEPCKINISGFTYNLVKDDIVCKYRGAIEAKHKGKIDMYYV